MSDEASVPTITTAELRDRLQDKNTFVLDLRAKGSGEQIPGALQYDPKQVEAADPLVLPIPHDGVTVLVDDRGVSTTVRKVAAALARAKYLDVRALEGGHAAWKDAGFPLGELTLKQPVAGAAEHQLFR